MEDNSSGSQRPGLERRPETRAESLESLIRRTGEGRVRIPSFQRGLRWESRDVLDLFDSIHQGLPIGSLLFWKRPAPADRLLLGPLEIVAPEVADAWWVVDGQQRLTAITVALSRPLPLPETPQDPYVVFFDPVAKRFQTPSRGRRVPDDWVPLPYLLDATALGHFVLDTPRFQDRTVMSALFEAGKRMREYQVPLYIVEADDTDVLRQIFFRINKSGKPLQWPEVHDALYGGSTQSPSTLDELAENLESMGMGRPAVNELNLCLLAMRGQDVTRTLAEHLRRDREILRGAVSEALPVLKQVLSFLKRRAFIPHLRLLPHVFVLEPLARFFALHPDPGARVRELLVRWVWRVLVSEPSMDERTLRRRAVSVIMADAEESVLQMLELVPRRRLVDLEPPLSFDARASRSRLALLSLANLTPHDLRTASPVDVARLLRDEAARAFPKVVTLQRTDTAGVSNRVIHPAGPGMRRLVELRFAGWGPQDPVLASHAIYPDAARALMEGRLDVFFRERGRSIQLATEALADRMAGWTRRDRDRPSIHYLLGAGKDDVA